METPRPILVTGSHRSGTTWVGRMLAASPSVGYIQEPFNVRHDPGLCAAQFDSWYTYVGGHNEARYYQALLNTVRFGYSLGRRLRSRSRPCDLKAAARKYLTYLWYRWSHRRPLLKDPIAFFSAEWLTSRFNMDTLVMIRHPAAFTGSLKEKDWTFPFSDLMDQPLLIREHLGPFAAQIAAFASEEKGIVDQAALIWNLIHYRVLQYQKDHPGWIFLRHEDLSQDPISGFRALFGRLGLDFTDQIAATIGAYSCAPAAAPRQPDDPRRKIGRDSRSNIQAWKKRLTPAEIERLRPQVEGISREFYSDDDW